ELNTVGGMAANNSGGEKNLKYGKTARYVEELEVVLGDGRQGAAEPLPAETVPCGCRRFSSARHIRPLPLWRPVPLFASAAEYRNPPPS
ncbi:MAG: FAD-dependent oxidoreductase, partial [Acidobacteriia bacterium]|nr:FAD-dependent oxidoreductase [Terriglobia bacterium]